MLTGELRSKIEKVWEQFWTGGLSNPITIIENMSLFAVCPYTSEVIFAELLL
jgi:hypothetical protein